VNVVSNTEKVQIPVVVRLLILEQPPKQAVGVVCCNFKAGYMTVDEK
jgi:hypothetical protein